MGIEKYPDSDIETCIEAYNFAVKIGAENFVGKSFAYIGLILASLLRQYCDSIPIDKRRELIEGMIESVLDPDLE